MNLQPYPEYKDSGIAWLGEVPKHWEIHPNRALFYERNKKNNPEMELLSVTITKGVIRQKELISNTSKKDSSNEDKSKYKLVKQGDIAYNKMRMWQGAVGASKYEGIVSSAYIIVHPRVEMNEWFCHYLFRSPKYVKESHRYSYGICDDQLSLRIDDFKRIFTPKPQLEEQRQIVKFIDYKTAQIARFIKAKKRMIELLKEQKQVIINNAVTGKIDVATGKPYPKYKDSGVEWLGHVPEGWEVKKLKHLYQNINEQTNKKLDDEIYLALENVESWSAKITLSDEEIKFESQVKKFREEDILFGKLRPYLAKVVKPDFKGVCVSEFLVLRKAADDVVPNYLELKLRSKVIIDVINQSTFGAKMPRADWGFIGNLMLSIPSIQEQHQIVSYIETRTAALDLTISRTEREIALIQEYRTRLISDAVTGKVDVRDIKIPYIADIDDTIDESIDELEGEEESETAEVEE